MNDIAEFDDPYLWLEEIDGDRAVAWVEAQNRRTCERLCDAGFDTDKAALTAIYDADTRIPAIVQRGGQVYNFWTDTGHKRGVWRRTTLDDYRHETPNWDILLDLDELCDRESQSWVWHGAQTLPPAHDRALIHLSAGGSDAGMLREFDLAARRFTSDGFTVPVAKTSAVWDDPDTILIATAHGGDTTESGYARTVRRWRRGTRLEDAPIVFEVEPTDIAASVYRSHDPAHRFTLFVRTIEFYRAEYHYQPDGGSCVKLDLPIDADIDIGHRRMLVRLRSEWSAGEKTFAAGSLLAIAIENFLAGSHDFAAIYAPGAWRALESWVNLKFCIVLAILDNVASTIEFADAEDGWRIRPIEGLPANSAVHVQQLAPDDPESETLLFDVGGFLAPDALMLGGPDAKPEVLKRLPPQFDASGLEVRQYEATARDGTAIPYFVVSPDAPPPEGGWPVYLTGYGGFEVSLTPGYLAAQGALWCAKGGAFVQANIRGGGEFGPDWHKAGIREGKKIAQDDFAAVAADLVKRGLTWPSGILGAGGSNGGLLVGNMLTRHPEAFGAIFCTVPLLDMKRYTKLLAGHSWIAEYGDPDKPEDWAFLREISPYQCAVPEQNYPPALIATTRRDDRVHPGHARKMAATLQAMGYDALYYEQAEGGHGAGADAAQRAFFHALGFAFARRTVGVGMSGDSRAPTR